MDRQIVFPGAIPLETDLLNTNRFTMIAIAKLAASVMGSNTYLNGLACTASSPASMVINIAPGEIYSLQNIDPTAYSSLPADTIHSILKQGILLSATSFTLVAPSTAGQSINYLIQVGFQDVDSGATVLPYYNASNPSQAYSGPNNSGIAQNTIRSGVCSVSVKTGVSATTGSQATPSPDAGYVGAYVVTVNQGQTTITSTSINLAANAPFLPKNGLVSGIQSNTMNYSADTGTTNNYVTSYFPAVTQLTDGLRLTFKARNNNTAPSTFSPNGLASAPIYTRLGGALTGGEIAQNKIMEVEWNSTLSAWTLISGSDPLAIGALQKSANLSDLASIPTALTNLGLDDVIRKSDTNVQLPGQLTTKGNIKSTDGDLYSGDARFAHDGNIFGTVWGDSLFGYIDRKQPKVTTIYINAGTPESPYQYPVRSRQTFGNPFPGRIIECKAELFINNIWGATGFIYSSDNSWGVTASPFDNSERIVVQSGRTGTAAISEHSGGVHGISYNVNGPLPIRLKVWTVD